MKHSSKEQKYRTMRYCINLLVAYSELMKIEPCANYIGPALV